VISPSPPRLFTVVLPQTGVRLRSTISLHSHTHATADAAAAQDARSVQRSWKALPAAACTLAPGAPPPLLASWVSPWLFGGGGHPGVREAVRDAPAGGAACELPTGSEQLMPFVCELARDRCAPPRSLPCAAYDAPSVFGVSLRQFLADGRPVDRLECGDVACEVGTGAAVTAAADGVIMDAFTIGGALDAAAAGVVEAILWPPPRRARRQLWAYAALHESAAYHPWLESGKKRPGVCPVLPRGDFMLAARACPQDV
jgi:hypothetical protein